VRLLLLTVVHGGKLISVFLYLFIIFSLSRIPYYRNMGKKHAVNEQFFDVWSNEMAYVLGYMYADGNLEYSPSIRGKYVRFFSTDLDRVELVRKLMRSEHVFTLRKALGNRKPAYLLSIGSHVLFDALLKIGVTPNKSLTALLPDIPEENLGAFALGYFDGDGCVFIERGKSGNTKKLLTVFTSGSSDFLGALHSRLVATTGILGKGLYKHGSTSHCFQLRYSTRDSIRLFLLLYANKELVELALLRKYAIYTTYFTEKKLTVEDLSYVLEQKGPMVKRKHGSLQNSYCAGSIPARASKNVLSS
jgi:hypothetical protein